MIFFFFKGFSLGNSVQFWHCFNFGNIKHWEKMVPPSTLWEQCKAERALLVTSKLFTSHPASLDSIWRGTHATTADSAESVKRNLFWLCFRGYVWLLLWQQNSPELDHLGAWSMIRKSSRSRGQVSSKSSIKL